MVNETFQVRRVLQELEVLEAFQVQEDFPDPVAQVDQLDSLVFQVRLVCQEEEDLQDCLDPEATQVGMHSDC